MKFPLRERPFPNFSSLTPQECNEYEALLHKVIDATIEEHQRFVHDDKRVLDKKLWRPVKQRDDVAVFRRIARELPEASGRRSNTVRQPAEDYHWKMPKMIAVGTIAGSLDDIMYGIVTPDSPTIVVKTSYVNDELADSAVLHTIRGASQQDPFHYTGFKWIAKTHPLTLNTVAWPRDFVFIESNGLRTLPDGSRMGFHVVHSVDHPQCPSLESQGILRSKFSSCYLYFPRDPGTVEVYMMTFVQPNGNAPEVFALMSAANTMVGSWKSVWCAQNKMLAYLLTNDAARRRFLATSKTTTSVPSGTNRLVHCCSLCTKAFGSFRSVSGCQLCSAWVCSKCRIARKLSFSDYTLELTQRVVQVCKSCIDNVAAADKFDAALDQYVLMGKEGDSLAQVPLLAEQLKRPRHCSADSSGTQPGSLTLLGDFSFVRGWRDDNEIDESRTRSRDISRSVAMETIDDWGRRRKSTPILSSSAESSLVRASTSSIRSSMASDLDGEVRVVAHQDRLMRTMQSLCLAAERTYQITSRTGSFVLGSSGRGTKK